MRLKGLWDEFGCSWDNIAVATHGRSQVEPALGASARRYASVQRPTKVKTFLNDKPVAIGSGCSMSI
jgi:hypothetical protein